MIEHISKVRFGWLEDRTSIHCIACCVFSSNKSESRKICVAGYQCDNSDFDFCIAEHNELPVIKICSDEGRDDCQQLKPKGTEASLGTTVITATILFIISILFSRVTVNVLVFVLRVVFFHLIVYRWFSSNLGRHK